MSQIVDCLQGSPEWHEHRAQHFNASEAAAVMGLSSYISRSELLRQKATGIVPEVDEYTQKLFDAGHANEAIARPWAEEIIGDELYPVTLSAEVHGLKLSASYDGLTFYNEVSFEHKTLNAALEKSLADGVIPEEYHPQMEQGLLISGASKCLFMASKSGDRDTMRHAWYESQPEVRAQLLAAWKQFDKDLANYEHAEPTAVPVGEAVTQLPSVSAQVSGSLEIVDNLKVFEAALRDFIDNRLITSPQTDQDFADLDSQIKTLEKAESALDAAEATVLSMVSAVDTFKRTKDMLHAMARDNRLMAQKLLKAEKENRKAEILARGKAALQEHIAQISATLGNIRLPNSTADFASAMKGKRTITSLNDAVDTELARAKIEANAAADQIRVNREILRTGTKGYEFLFRDIQQLVMHDSEHLKMAVEFRIRDHKAAEEAKLEAERERIRAEEKAKAEAEAARAAAPAKVEQETVAAASPYIGGDPGIMATPPAPIQRATKQRPADNEIIGHLCAYYQADEQTVISWLKQMDFSERAA